MSAPERGEVDVLARDYAAALAEFLSGAGEAALARAYDLGRTAAVAGRGILDVALVHHEALQRLAGAAGPSRPAAALAGQFLAEALSPFEMTLRSYQANARLLGLSESLAQQNAEIDRAREQLRTILDATTAVIYLKDAEGRYLFVNREFQRLFGRSGESVLGKVDGEVLAPEVARTLGRDDRRVVDSRAPQEVEESIPGPDGAHTYLSLKFPLLDASGAAYGICCVATDITERKRAAEAAERERQLTQAVRARDQFLQIASHELKTPLTALELQVASLRFLGRSHPDTKVSDARVGSKFDVIVKQVERLTVLMNNLLDVGRIVSGDLGLQRAAVDLGEVVGAVLAGSQEAIKRSGSPVAVSAPAPVVGIWDRERLETVVANLVSNAVKFGAGKPIEIAVEARGERAILTVRDHGIGVSDEDQQRIFDRFERAVSERHFGGFGIGLWVARQNVEAHGGAIRVRSRHGEGSEFTVELPLVAPPAA